MTYKLLFFIIFINFNSFTLSFVFFIINRTNQTKSFTLSVYIKMLDISVKYFQSTGNDFDTIRYYLIRFCTIWHEHLYCDTIWYDVTRFNTIWYDFDTIWYDLIRFNTIWHDLLRSLDKHNNISSSIYSSRPNIATTDRRKRSCNVIVHQLKGVVWPIDATARV